MVGGRIINVLIRLVIVLVGYYYYQKNSLLKGGGGGSYFIVIVVVNGGWINGFGGLKVDVILVWLLNGEFVVNVVVVSWFGVLFEVINWVGGCGFFGVVRNLFDVGIIGGLKLVNVMQFKGIGGGFGLGVMVMQVLLELVSVFLFRFVMLQSGFMNVFNINNQYFQVEFILVMINWFFVYVVIILGV